MKTSLRLRGPPGVSRALCSLRIGRIGSGCVRQKRNTKCAVLGVGWLQEQGWNHWTLCFERTDLWESWGRWGRDWSSGYQWSCRAQSGWRPLPTAVASDSGCTPDECSGRSALWGSKIDNRELTTLTGWKKERKKCFLLSIFGIPSFPRNKLPCVQSSSIKRGKNTSNHWHYFFKHIQCREDILLSEQVPRQKIIYEEISFTSVLQSQWYTDITNKQPNIKEEKKMGWRLVSFGFVVGQAYFWKPNLGERTAMRRGAMQPGTSRVSF